MMSDWIDVARVDEFKPGEIRVIDVNDVMVAVFNIDGEYFAIENQCTHDGSELIMDGLNPADQINNDRVVCPHHGAEFCIRTGAVLSPPAYEDIATFPVRVEHGTVQVMAVD